MKRSLPRQSQDTSLRAAALACLVLLGFAATACGASGYVAPKPDKASVGGGEQRNDCGAIYSTAFRSAQERQWFEENCSKWPATRFGDIVVARPAGPAQPAQCDAMRGKPYESNEQRRWYLENCSGAPPAGAPAAVANANPSGAPPGPPGPDRTDCNAIRGTDYRSGAEQAWYLRNCQQPVASEPPQARAPDRFDCNAIRGTPYNSDGERAWYQQNCG
jgi:hypothetical protein